MTDDAPVPDGARPIEVLWDLPDPAPVDDDAVAGWALAALEHGGRPDLGLSVVFVGDARLAEMHGEFLGDPTATDVITFDLGDGDGPGGELYVSAERAQAVARERGVDPKRELALYVVHGALHLCGFDDHDPDERASMRDAERTVLLRLGFENDDAPHDV